MRKAKQSVELAILPAPAVVSQESGRNWTSYLGDCLELLPAIPSDSIDYSIFSPPFSSLYTYSNSERDMGNCRTYAEFCENYKFFARELYRVLKPGRLLSFHCMLLPSSKQFDGFIGLKDFRGDLIRAHAGNEVAEMDIARRNLLIRATNAEADGDLKRSIRLQGAAEVIQEDMRSHPAESGLIYHSEVVIWKDPVTAMQRTKSIRLLHKQLDKDSAMSGQGIPDYLITMRKPGVNETPIQGPLDYYAGDQSDEEFTQWCFLKYQEQSKATSRPMPFETYKSIQIWQRYASPVWTDINPSNTLQRASAREERDERHICPLQLQVIERAVQLWSLPGEVVLSPCAGIASEGYVAVGMGRRSISIELKESYWKQGCLNLRRAETEEKRQGGLFDAVDEVPEEVLEAV